MARSAHAFQTADPEPRRQPLDEADDVGHLGRPSGPIPRTRDPVAGEQDAEHDRLDGHAVGEVMDAADLEDRDVGTPLALVVGEDA